jgi:hypothetical protein
MKRVLFAILVFVVAVPVMAPTDISPGEAEVAEPQKIYSP